VHKLRAASESGRHKDKAKPSPLKGELQVKAPTWREHRGFRRAV